jgi:transcriptional regulator of acetoin/glycerol metabolism
MNKSEIPCNQFPKYKVFHERIETIYLRRAMKLFNGKINLTARQTGINKATLIRRLNKYGLHPKMILNHRITTKEDV